MEQGFMEQGFDWTGLLWVLGIIISGFICMSWAIKIEKEEKDRGDF